MLMQIPVANMGKRLAGPSQEPSSRPQKKAPDMASLGSLESEAPMETKEEEAQLEAAGQPPNLESAWGQYKPGQGSSQAMSSRLPGRSMMTGQEEGSLQNHMLTLLLQCSTRLRDLEAINFYTHVIPASSTLYKELEKTYQGYLYTASQTKQHGLGPPMIHRGKTLLDQVLLGQEALKEKEGLKPLWPIVLESRNIIIADDMNVDEAANMIGHCKMYVMYDKSFFKLVFVMPYIVTVNGKCTTLGSVVSRLLRSMGFERKTGVAPPGYLERQIKAAIDARKQY